MCDLDVGSDGTFNIHDWTVESCVVPGVNVNKTAVHELAPPFIHFVNSKMKSWLYNLDGSQKDFSKVFIENQPLGGRGSARNLKTKVLSHILQCAILTSRPELEVVFIHPGLKLKDMARTEGKSTYRENKLYAIQKTSEIVEGPLCFNRERCKTLYNVKKMKKDDFADSFLQGYFAGLLHVTGNVVGEGPKTEAAPKSEAHKTTEGPKKAMKRKATEDSQVTPPVKKAAKAPRAPRASAKASEEAIQT